MTRVNVSTADEQADFGSIYDNFSLSGDAGAVAFDSAARNLVPGDNNGTYDVFVHTR